jgi:serine protease
MKCRGFAFAQENKPKMNFVLALTLGVFFAMHSAYAEDYVVELKAEAATLMQADANDALAEPDSRLATITPPEQLQASEDYCERLLATGFVKSCSPNFEVSINKTTNDPQSNALWGLDRIEASKAWEIATGSTEEVVIAGIDTGIDYSHPDLAANMWTNPGEIPGDGIDNDANGYIDDVHGVNAALGSGNPMDDNGHGTHTAGTIGAVGDNGIGVVGVAWRVKIMALKFLNANGGGTIADAIRAINYLVKMKTQYGVNIVAANNSWGGGGFSQPLYDAIKRARDAGIVFVAAAGNEANNNDLAATYPAGYDLDNVISVGAIDKSNKLAYFSNYGQAVDVAAPGVGILSTVPGGGYAALSGTSMAAPHVAGAVALLAGHEPSLTYSALINRIIDSGTTISALTGKVRGARFLNLERLLNGSVEETPGETTPQAIVSKVTVFGASSAVRPVDGSRFTVKVKGSGSGEVAVRVYFNGNDYCEETGTVQLSSGRATLRGKLPLLTKQYRRIGFEIGGTRSSAKLNIRKGGVRRARYSAAESPAVCESIFASLN